MDRIKQYSVKLDFTRSVQYKPINLVQYDAKGADIVMTLTSNKIDVSLEGCTVSVEVLKKDGTVNVTQLTEITDNIATFTPDMNDVSCVGKTIMTLSVFKDDGKTTSIQFFYTVTISLDQDPSIPSTLPSTFISFSTELSTARGGQVDLNTRLNLSDASLAQKAPQTDLTTGLFLKRDKATLIELTEFSDSAKQAIAGTASIYPSFSDFSVTPIKTTFFKTGKNLFDKSKLILGSYIQNTDGTVAVLASLNASDWIRVLPSTVYTKKSTTYYCYYDINKVYISGVGTGGTATVTTPSNCYYMRTTIADADINISQFELGSVATIYEAYYQYVDTALIKAPVINTANIVDKAIIPSKISNALYYAELFNPTTVTIDGYINASGAFVAYGSGGVGGVSDYIPVVAGQTYNWFNQAANGTAIPISGAWYKDDNSFVANVDGTGQTTITIVAPTLATKLKINYAIPVINSVTCKSTTPSSVVLPWLGFNSANIVAKSVDATKLSDDLTYKINNPVAVGTAPNTRWYGKTANFLGDSQTYGAFLSDSANQRFSTLVATALGMTTVNYGVSGTLLAEQSEYTNPFVDRYSGMGNADLIVILAGTNDYFFGTGAIGAITSVDSTTFNGALNNLITGLQNKYPLGEIVFITTYSQSPDTRNSDALNPVTNLSLKGYRDCIIERCLFHGVPVLDLYSIGGIDAAHSAIQKSTYTIDGCHPNIAGHQRICDRLAGFLKTL